MKKKWILITPVVILLLILPAIAVGMEERRTAASLNEGELADKVKIEVIKGTWLETLLRGSVFKVTLWNGNDCTIDYFLNVEVISKKGEVIFEHKHDLIEDFTPGLLDIIGFWYYVQFRQKDFLFGRFDVNVKIQVVNDGSVKTQTAHGFIFGISAIMWD